MKKKVLAIGTVAVVTLSGAFFSQEVHAETLEDVQSKQQEVNSQLSKAESKIATILYEIKEINEEINRLQFALDENNKQIDKTETDIKGLQEDIDVLNEKIEQRNEILKNRIASYQENGGQINYMDVVLGAEGFGDFISRISAVTTITNADMELLEENEKDKEAVQVKLTEQEDLKQELEYQKETIKVQKEQQEAGKKKLQEKEEKLQKEKAELQSESSALRALESEIRASMAAPATANSDEISNSSTNSSGNSNGSSSSSKAKADSTPQVAYTGGGGSAIDAGKQFIGRSTYAFGKRNPSTGQFDCSGFVQWAYKQEGVSLPGHTGGMAGVGTKVDYSQAKPGDLVFFDTYKKNGHVGIYLGGGKFLGSQSSTGVGVADMNSGYWKKHFSGHVRRVK